MPPTLAPGQIVDQRYALDHEIGSDALGSTWEAYDQGLERSIRLREIVFPGEGPHDDRLRRALAAARAAIRLDIPGALHVYDAFVDGGRLVVVSERSPAPPLPVVVARRPLAEKRAAAVGADLALPLEAAHSQGIVHGLIAPAAVLLPDRAPAVLAGFGLAPPFAEDADLEIASALADPAYLAPEQAGLSGAGPAADVWALGATLYFALEGEPPVGPPGSREAGTPAPPRRAGALWPVLEGMLADDPAARPSLEEVRGRLAEIAGVPPGGPPAPPRPGRWRRRRRGADGGDDVAVAATGEAEAAAAAPGDIGEAGDGEEAGAGTESDAGGQVPWGVGTAGEAGDGTVAGAGAEVTAAGGPDGDGAPGTGPQGGGGPVAGAGGAGGAWLDWSPATADAAPVDAPGDAGPHEARPPDTGGVAVGAGVESPGAPAGEPVPAGEAVPAGEPVPAGEAGVPAGGSGDSAGDSATERRYRSTPSWPPPQQRRSMLFILLCAWVLVVLVGLLVTNGQLARPRSSPDAAAGRPELPVDPQAVPSDWVAYRHATAPYGVSYPPGWKVREEGTLVEVSDPATGAFLRVDARTPAGPDPHALALDAERNFSLRHPDTYRRLQLSPARFLDRPAALWEYVFVERGTATHAAELRLTSGKWSVTLLFQAPDGSWQSLLPAFRGFLDSVRPPPR